MHMLVKMLILLAVGTVLVWWAMRRCRKGNREWTELKKFRYAHRGLHSLPDAPENSMEAFRRAVEKGYGIELDVHLMADGQLAVIHDSSLQRTAGADVRIEDLKEADLAQYPLEGTNQTVPVFCDVVDLVDSRVPLIVELKPVGNNVEAMCRETMEVLRGYKGLYCVESFDPRVGDWFKRHRPAVCRGQLSENFMKRDDSRLSKFLRFFLTHLLVNSLSKPDFVAYRFEDRKLWSLRIHRDNRVWWTITNAEDMKLAEKHGATVIFEGFEPETPVKGSAAKRPSRSR